MTSPSPQRGLGELVAWIRDNRASYTDAALRARLLAAGHPAEDVDRAFAELDRSAPMAGPAARRPAGATLHPVIGYAGTLLVVVALPWLLLSVEGGGTIPFGAALITFLLAVFLWASLREGRWRGISTGIGFALITVIVVPVVAVVGIFGYCLVVGVRV